MGVTAASASALSPKICEPARASYRAERVPGERSGGCPARDARVRKSLQGDMSRAILASRQVLMRHRKMF